MAETETRIARSFWGVDMRAVVLSGVIAAIVFLILEMALVPLLGVSVWAPIRMMAAILLGPEVLPPPATFALGIFVAAVVIHFTLSLVYAFILGLIIRGQNMAIGIGVGLVFGLLLYVVNFFIFTEFFPWFAEARNWVNVVAHLAFGAIAGGVYIGAEAPELGTRTLTEEPA